MFLSADACEWLFQSHDSNAFGGLHITIRIDQDVGTLLAVLGNSCPGAMSHARNFKVDKDKSSETRYQGIAEEIRVLSYPGKY